MKSFSIVLTAVILSVSFPGCSTNSSLKENKYLNALMLALEKYSAEMEKKRSDRLIKGINSLTLEKRTDDFIVSADLDKASIPEVVHRLFHESGKSYSLDNVELYGNITACFNEVLFFDALNIILEPILLSAEVAGETTVIKNRQADKPSEIYMKVPMKNLDTETAVKFLKGLYPTVNPDVYVSHEPTSNTICFRGAEDRVSRAVQALIKMDNDIRHVMIEALVVEYNVGVFEELGTKIRELSDGRFSNVSLNYSVGASGDIITFK
ncbi:MAG: hypothetical protein GY749_39375 [Desulfobacteraceae bacterium]|nr:hypothetical protein [Desulfobacteraceae bacterium]